MNNSALGAKWEDVRKELYTSKEIAVSDLRVALIGEMIKAREEKGITQKELEEMSGIKQPMIARIEKGKSIPQLETVQRLLFSLGKKLVIADLKE